MNPNTDITPEEFQIIEQYLLRQMPGEEYDAFTYRIENDAVLKNKVDSVRLLLLGVQEATLTNKIKDFHKDLKRSTGKKPLKGSVVSMKRWLAAASIIVIAALGILFFLNRTTNKEKLFAAYYKPDPGLVSAMSASDNYTFDRAMIDYKTGKYDSAIKSWKSLLVSNPNSDTLNYFIGSAYLAQKNNDKAIEYFKKVMANTKSYFLNDAYWYTGLALLHEGKLSESVPFIEKSEHPNKEELLQKLKK